MKRFWLKLLLLAPIPLLVIAFNWLQDPVHLRDAGQYEYGIARLVLEGKRVTNISNPNEAAYIKFIVDGLRLRRDVLVFGSSRSKLIRSDCFPRLSLFNNSISGAGLTDYLAIYEIYRQKKLTPSIAVVELSPWILMRDHASIWKTLNANRHALEQRVLSPDRPDLHKIRIHTVPRADWWEFLSLGYFQTSFYTWLNRRTHPVTQPSTYFVWQEGTLPTGETLLADGSALYPEYVQNPRDRERVTALAVEYARAPAGIPSAIDASRQKILEALLDQLSREGVQPILYLPPYHPKTYALMANSPQNRIIIEEQHYFEQLAQRKNLKLVGSYNPADLHLDERSFFDGSHPTEEAVRKLFTAHLPTDHRERQTNNGEVDHIELTGIDNPNGLETIHGKPFFWIGQGETCLSFRSPRTGIAVIAFHAQPGPSLPNTPIRNLSLTKPDGSAEIITLQSYPNMEIHVPVKPGRNEIFLTPLDAPTVPVQSNGDRRPLLLGVTDVRIRLLPAGAN